MNQEKINLQQARDFGETFNASIKILRQNFRLFFQSILFLGGPFILLSSIAGAFYQSNALSMYSPSRILDMKNLLQQFGLAYLLFIIAALIANLMIMGTVFSFLMVYQEKGPGNFTVNDVGKTLRQNIGNILAIFFVFFAIGIVLVALLAGILYAIASAIPVLGVLVIIFLFLGILAFCPPFVWQFSVVYLVKMKEDKGVFESLGKTWNVLRGNFWWTWLIVVCSSIAIAIAGFVFTLPQAAYQMFIAFSNIRGGTGEVSIPFLMIATVCTFCATLLQSVLHLVNGVHYYSLAEKKDGEGLIERINEIGNMPTNNVNQQY